MISRHMPLIVALAVSMGLSGGALGQAKPARLIGKTESGQPVYKFRLTRTSIAGIARISDQAIAARAKEVCPGGYRELSRRIQEEQRGSGVIYRDVDVTLVCG